ncbi:hypothetical protein V6N12_027687 [Hibiscus sabdariffa]|uniref:Uncharacterized protein n=1 Tax=Hibiscus sabdariffa TaxID=183260 RepID=A0ABR2F3M6_9ROSI
MMSQQLELALPRFIAFGLNPKGSYLHQHFQNNKKKFAKFEGRSCTLFHIRRTSAESPYAKFEVEFATADHGHCRMSADYRVLAEFDKYDIQGWDIFQLIDWSSLLILPSLRLMTLVIQLCHQRLLLLQTETSVSSPLVLINSGGVALTGVEWGETKTSTTVVEVVVPAMTKVTVNLVATKGTCDVPFTYMQRDTLYDGSTHTSEIEGNTYTGSNYYNINFVTKAKKLG